MKKVIIALAVVLSAGIFTSCGNTEACYEVTVKYGTMSLSGYFYGTGNELETYKKNLKDTYQALAGNEDLKITSFRSMKSKDDCTGGQLRF